MLYKISGSMKAWKQEIVRLNKYFAKCFNLSNLLKNNSQIERNWEIGKDLPVWRDSKKNPANIVLKLIFKKPEKSFHFHRATKKKG